MRKKLQWVLVSRLAIAGALLFAIATVERDIASRSSVFVLAGVAGAIVLLSAVFFILLRTSIPFKIQGYIQLLSDLLLVTWLVYNTGDVQSPFLALYLVIIIAASALFERRGVGVLAGFAAILYVATSLLTLTGTVARASGWPTYEETSFDFRFLIALNLVAIFAVAVLSSHLAERVKRSESQLASATKDLADYRLFNDRIIESMRSGLVTTDLRGCIITFNRAAEEITGYKAADIRGSNICTIFGDIEKEIEVGLESIRARSRLPRFAIDCRTADDRELHLGFSVAPLVDEVDHSRGYVLTFQDLTEVNQLQREVLRQERLAALGKMAAGLAHEIRNPLASMRGSVQVLASELNLLPDQSQLMEIVLRESDRLNRIVSDFLTYARPPRSERTVIEIASILSETVALLRNSTELRPDHIITEEYPAEPIHYSADPNQIRQIFWNLSRNAIQAMPDGGELRLSLEATQDSDVSITFSDNGEGMTSDQKERLFEPFSSSSGGTGLGMAIVDQLVRDHSGDIVVDSQAGKGTQISIRLPANGRVTARPEHDPVTDSPGVALAGPAR